MQKMLNEWGGRGQKKQLKKSVLNMHKLPIKTERQGQNKQMYKSVQNVPKNVNNQNDHGKTNSYGKVNRTNMKFPLNRKRPEKKMNGWKKVYWMCKKKYRLNQEEKGKTNK